MPEGSDYHIVRSVGVSFLYFAQPFDQDFRECQERLFALFQLSGGPFEIVAAYSRWL